MCQKVNNIEELRESIEEIIEEEVVSDDSYVGIYGADDAADKIIDLLKNNFMLFFE